MSTPYYEDGIVTVFHGDCLDVLRELDDASVDAVCTDPPYGLEFMGKDWDSFKSTGSSSLLHSPKDEGREFTNASGHMFDNTKALPRFPRAGLPFQAWCAVWAAECLRVLKPGGHMLAFGGSRTWHRLAAGIEDAGFEIRDGIAWLYGSGFPKSLDVSKAIDKALGVEGSFGAPKSAPHAAHIGKTDYSGADKDPGWERPWMHDAEAIDRSARVYEGGSEQAKAFEGWGTALKPAFEPVVVARKPLTGTVAATVLAYGTGALNIDANRIGDELITAHGGGRNGEGRTYGMGAGIPAIEAGSNPHHGRWPTNVVLDESQAAELDRQSGVSASPSGPVRQGGTRGFDVGSGGNERAGFGVGYGDSGGASRFFPTFRYEAKAPSSERPNVDGVQHPTVKPLDLMRWLVRLVTPPGGVVLEPFAGSGTTVEAAVLEGFRCVAIEREAEYLPLIEQRLSKPMQQSLFDDLGGVA